jgi:hypothetical protein
MDRFEKCSEFAWSEGTNATVEFSLRGGRVFPTAGSLGVVV